jgi:glutamate---cysteine ligase / carboxylate-amine ligase
VIDEEYQLVEMGSGALRARAPELLADDWSGAAKEEYQRTMLEVNTSISKTAIEAGEAIRERRQQMAELAGRKGLAIAAAGVQPVGVFPASQLSEEPRYWRLAARGGVVARELHIFGMHVHVAVPDRDAAVRAMCGVAPYLPPLLALGASSPFHLGRDTAYASFRTALRDMFPRVGVPMPVASTAEYDRLIDVLGGTEGGESPVSWDARPSARYPTLEFRFLDVVPWVDLAAGLAACARTLTAMYADRPPQPRTGLYLQLLRENRWRAARFGRARIRCTHSLPNGPRHWPRSALPGPRR